MPSLLQTEYTKTIRPALKKELGITNDLAVPKVSKVVVNVGIGSIIRNRGKDYSKIVEHLAKITGQQPSLRNSRVSISNFKLREGEPVGLTVTLRGPRMYDFLTKLVNVALPRVRDFRGIPPKSFDARGNYSLGIREHYVFPETIVDDEVPAFGFQVTVVTTAKSPEHSRALLKMFGFPFRDR